MSTLTTKKENTPLPPTGSRIADIDIRHITWGFYLLMAYVLIYFILGEYSSPTNTPVSETGWNHLPELVILLTTLIFSVASIAASILLRLYYHRNIALEYLGWGILSGAVWNITNSDLRLILFRNPQNAENISFLMMMIMPVPFFLFMNFIQKERYKKAYIILSVVILAEFTIYSVLSLAGILNLADGIFFTIGFLILSIFLTAATIFSDIKNRRIQEYPLVAGGMSGVWLTILIRGIGFFQRGNQKSSSVLPIGLIVLLLIAVIHTIYELLDMERKKQQALSASEAKGRFLANMSHEIRTPINAVLGMDAMILRECTEPQIKEYALDIQNAGQSLLALINDILDLSKIESGKLEILPEEYDFSSLIHDIINMITMKAADKDLKVNLCIDEKLPSRLRGDDIRLRQGLVNLMNNAVKYTEKGSVTLSVSGTVNENSAILTFQVEDTGIGIKEEDIGKLFAEFERIEEQRNRNVEGTGLGMSITTQLLELMGSHLQVESIYGKGSKFYFTLQQDIILAEPIGNLEQRIQQQAADYTYQVTFTAPEAQVLVVDDNTVNRKVFRNLLKATKIKVEEAAGGLECLNMAGKKPYDMIFLDHMMPDLDGIETLHRLKENMASPCFSIPIIALTANAVSGAKEMYLSEGFHSFLSKPVNPQKLEQMLMENLPKEKVIIEKTNPNSSMANGIQQQKTPESTTSRKEKELPAIEGIDWNYAMLYTRDKEMLLSTVHDFYQMMDTEAEQLEQFYNKVEYPDDLKQFRVKVHSMKSSAAMIGAVPLSGIAKLLEDSARAERIDTIQRVTPSFLEEWQHMKERLKPYMQDSQESEIQGGKRKVDCQMILEYLRLLGNAIRDMDIDTSDEIIKQLNSFRYPKSLDPVLKQLNQAVKNIDIMLTTETIQTFENQMKQNGGSHEKDTINR